MKPISEPVTYRAANALGHDITSTRQDFEIEDERKLPHYLGYNYRHHKVSKGQVITIYKYGGCTSWDFKKTTENNHEPNNH